MPAVIEIDLTTRITLRHAEAAAALGMSQDAFAKYVAAELPVIRKGSMKLYPVASLRAWAERNAAKPLVEELSA